MKKILTTLVILFAASSVQFASACSQSAESITGAACSIKDLKTLEKSKTSQEKVLSPQTEKNLRPVRTNPGMQKSDDDECLFGMCLTKRLGK